MGRRSVRRCGALAGAALVLAVGCGSPARAATTYETWEYTVSIPDDLGIAPLNTDPAYLWANPKTSFVAKTSSQGFALGFDTVAACDTGTMLASAQSAQARMTAPNQTEPQPVTYGPMPAAVFSGGGPGSELVVVVACSGSNAVYVFAGEIKRADVDAIMTTFRFRDPPGDPAHPPAASLHP